VDDVDLLEEKREELEHSLRYELTINIGKMKMLIFGRGVMNQT